MNKCTLCQTTLPYGQGHSCRERGGVYFDPDSDFFKEFVIIVPTESGDAGADHSDD